MLWISANIVIMGKTGINEMSLTDFRKCEKPKPSTKYVLLSTQNVIFYPCGSGSLFISGMYIGCFYLNACVSVFFLFLCIACIVNRKLFIAEMQILNFYLNEVLIYCVDKDYSLWRKVGNLQKKKIYPCSVLLFIYLFGIIVIKTVSVNVITINWCSNF